jgi:PKD repeat protein
MGRNALATTLATMMLVVGSLGLVLHSRSVASSTTAVCGELSGVISSDIILTQGCTYIVTDDVLLEALAKLTIERGVTLKFDGDYYMVIEGVVEAAGDETASIRFTSNRATPGPSDWDRIEFSTHNPYQQSLNYIVLEYSQWGLIGNAAKVSIGNSVFQNNGNAISLMTETGNGSTTITNTQFLYSVQPDSVMISGHDVIFTDNLVEYNVVSYPASPVIRLGCMSGEIARNSIVNNVADGFIWYVPDHDDDSCIHDNSVTNNRITSDGGAIVKTWTTFRLNNLHNNEAPYLLQTGSGRNDVDVTDNYWGTADPQEIADLIYDYHDDSTLKQAIYDPYATEPISHAPVLPAAGFTAWPTSGLSHLTVAFTNLSSGDYTNSLWDLGDGVTSTLESLTHTYTVADVYTVTLSVSGPSGTSVTVKPDLVVVYEPVTAAFTGEPKCGTVPLTVRFTDVSSGSVASWNWLFGDGGSSAFQHPTHIYTATGVYTVSLEVRMVGGSATWPGRTDILTRTNYITVYHGIYLPLVHRDQ